MKGDPPGTTLATPLRPARVGPPGAAADGARWRAVSSRDPRADGAFVFAVRTTGVYCRPSCPARRPRRQNVEFFSGPDAAERAGFRPCRRCHPRERSAHEPQTELVRAACALLARDPDGVRSLAELARRIGYSPWHLHRLFKRHTGLTPAEYRREWRFRQFKQHLKEGRQVSEAIVESGFGSTSRVYQRGGGELGMTPRAYREGGRGARIEWTVATTALGPILVAATGRGICSVRFGRSRAALGRGLAAEFPGATLAPAGPRLQAALRAVRAAASGAAADPALPLDVHATAFQRRVWRALRAIPAGATRSYGEIARRVGRPGAARAVGRACAVNPVALLIPCHRAVRADGSAGGYAWGSARKRRLLELESAGRERIQR